MTTEKHKLSVKTRNLLGRKVKQIRNDGQIPANIFGNKIKSLSIQVDQKKFLEVFSRAGESSLVYLHLDQEKDSRPVFISHVSKHPLSGHVLHVSFHQVDLKTKVIAPVPVVLMGESLAEKEKVGIMVQQTDEIEIEAFPTDMPESVHVEVSELSQPGDSITVKDLKLDSSKLNIKSDPDTVLVQIEALAKEEVATPAASTEVPGEDSPGTAPEETSESSETPPAAQD